MSSLSRTRSKMFPAQSSIIQEKNTSNIHYNKPFKTLSKTIDLSLIGLKSFIKLQCKY